MLYPIPNPNYTLPKPYRFIITYPIHYAPWGTQTWRVLPCASISTTLPWIPTYPYPSKVILYPGTYPTLPTVGKIPFPTIEYLPHLPHPRHLSLHTCTHLTLPFITYPNLHLPNLYYCQGLIKYKAETTYQIRPKQPRTETTQAETTQAETTRGRNDSGPKRPENAVAVVEQEHTCRVVHLIIWLSIFVRVRIFWTSNLFVKL